MEATWDLDITFLTFEVENDSVFVIICRRLIIRITNTIWQQAALAINCRRSPPDIRLAPVTRPRC